jgi:NADPH:quinone reductase-like Zn-dependent oxidoreductase
MAAAEIIIGIFKVVFGSPPSTVDCEMEFMERAGKLYTSRMVDDTDMNKFVHQETKNSAPEFQPFIQNGRPLKMVIASPGALDTLHFIDDSTAGTPIRDNEIEIEIKATSMNFKDVMIAMGQLSSDYLGIECSGVVSSVGSNVTNLAVGDHVTAMSEGAYANYTRKKVTSAFRIPYNMSLEAAATIPVVYCTAYYSLIDLARLCKGETVLIHAAAGGVGQAAILLSQMIGAEIFATVGTIEKKEFIIKEYGILEDHIFYSRDTPFAKAIKRATNNRGVDVVINSLAGDALRKTWDCLAHFGRFVEIGKRDIMGNSRLEMAPFEHNATIASVDLTVIAAERPQLMKRLLADVFALLECSKIRPISPITIPDFGC